MYRVASCFLLYNSRSPAQMTSLMPFACTNTSQNRFLYRIAAIPYKHAIALFRSQFGYTDDIDVITLSKNELCYYKYRVIAFILYWYLCTNNLVARLTSAKKVVHILELICRNEYN